MLVIKDLSVSYKHKQLISAISMSLAPGQRHLLVGPNGSGKSTLALTLMGHPDYTVTHGEIFFNGTQLLALSLEQRARAGIFVVQQHAVAIPGLTTEIFLYEAYTMLTGNHVSKPAFHEKIKELFSLVHLGPEFIDRCVNVGFSGGEQKKFELAQLLLFRPKFAVLDEIDMGLDTDGMRALEHVFSLLEHTTFLVITHARELPGFNPDQVHFFTEGKLVTSRVTGVRGREFYDQLSL